MNDISFVKQNFISYIDKIINNNKISHSYLFEVDDFETDSYYIYSFIKMILCNCTYNELLNCNNSIITQVDNNNYPDIMVIEPEGNWIKKSQLISLQKEYSNKSLVGNKRIYIIKNAECLNSSSANTMLKFLEEPSEDIIAILVTTNRYQVIDTILSRCQVISLKENNLSFNSNEDVLSFLQYIINPTIFFINYNYLIKDVLVDKNISYELFHNIENIIISYIHSKYNDGVIIDDKIVEVFKNYNDSDLILCLKVIEEELPKLKFNVNYKLWLDSLFSRLVIGG